MKTSACALFLSLFLHLASQVYAIKPDREYFMTPDSVGWKYEQWEIKTSDDYKLVSWVYEANPENSKDTVLILAYPDAGNMSYFVYYAAILANQGYTVVTFDYRGFGKSDDFEIQPDYLYYTEFAKDLEAVVNSVSSKFANRNLGLWGMSMGTTIISRAYPVIRDKVDFIIGEGYVIDTATIIERYDGLGKSLTLPEEPAKYQKALRSIDIPMLILTASDDSITTHQDAVNLKKSLGGNCEVVQYLGEHLTGFNHQLESKGFGGWYTEQIGEFIARHFQ